MSDSRTVAGGVTGPEDFGTDREGVAARWLEEIRFAQKECGDWYKEARGILARYRDHRPGRGHSADDVLLGRRMNLLWSNVQTLAPSIYAATPDPVVQRRFSDEDDVARVASTILQRTLAYQLEENDFDQIARECVLDNLLAGRGTVWIRYEPHFGREPAPVMPPLPTAAAMPMPAAPAGPGVAPGMGLPAGGPGGGPPLPLASVPPPGGPPGPPAMLLGAPQGPVAAGPPGAPPGPSIAMPPPGALPTPPPILSPEPLLSAGMAASVPIDQGGPARSSGRPKDGGVQIADTGETDEVEFLAWEEVRIDHVGWEDWLSNPARTWAELRWVARRAFMTKEQVAARFGPKLADDVPLSWHPADLSEQEALEPANQIFCRAQIWEVWDKPSRKAIWVATGYGERVLDSRDDPLRLPGFFPTPRPFYATLTTDTLVPVPDYQEYRDQAAEIDNLTARIHAIARAIKVAGTYDASQSDIARMFTEGVENQLIPVNQWAQFSQQGGLKGCMDLLDISSMADTLDKLLSIRAQAKQDLYEVTGISDIIRGSTVASETARAQQIKSQFGTMRLRARQAEMARFCRDTLRLVADVVCEHFQPRTMLMISDIAHQPGADAQLAQQAVALLKDEKSRPLRIDVETDSTIVADQQQEQQQRIAFLTMASQFLQQALPATQQYPAIAPLLGQMLLFGIRSFPKGGELEGAFEAAIKAMEQAPQQQSPPPDPKMMLAQAQVQNIQSQIANRQTDNQRDAAEAQARIQLEQAKAAGKAEVERRGADESTVRMLHEHEIDRRNVMLDAARIALDHSVAQQRGKA